MLEDMSLKLKGMPCIRMLSQTDAPQFVEISRLEAGAVNIILDNSNTLSKYTSFDIYIKKKLLGKNFAVLTTSLAVI